VAHPLSLPVVDTEPVAARDHVHGLAHDTNRVLSLAFVVAIALPLVQTLTVGRPAPGTDIGDGPHWPGTPHSVKDVGQWPTRFRRWFKDHYTLRRELIRAQGALVLHGLGVSPSPTVLIGKDGWWFYRDDNGLDDMTTVTPMKEEDLATWTDLARENQRWLAARGIPYLFVLAPDKHLIYPEYLPDGIHQVHEPWLVQFMRFFTAHSTVDTIDLRSLMLDAKRRERVYHRTDTHWNNRGALVASLSIMNWMARVHPGLTVPTGDDFEFTTYTEHGHDLAAMLGLEHSVTEEVLDVKPRQPRRAQIVEESEHVLESGRVVTEHSDQSLPRVLIIRDSFMTPLIPFLAEQCSRCVFLWQNYLDTSVVDREKPDIVIHEIVGRRLHTLTP
jgi:hypothetical protein